MKLVSAFNHRIVL